MSARFTAVIALALGVFFGAGGALAQIRHRRPFAPSVTVNYGFDNNSGGGCRDYNCGSRCYDGHSGTDFGIPLGTSVVAGADGVVVATNDGCANYGYVGNPCGGRCGNYVQLQHADGSRTIFCHMMRGSLAVSRGQRVRCGQTLGRSASSGSSSGPHVHFGWRRSATGASQDSYRGRCTSSPGAWVDQRSYPQSPDDRCACSASPEVCNDRDDDCDGRVDEGLTRGCYTGPAGTSGRGVCREGTQSCAAGRWGTCEGQVLPRAETCNRVDDDCDGTVDEGVCSMDAGTALDGSMDAAPDRADVASERPHDAPADRGGDTATDATRDTDPLPEVPEDTLGEDLPGELTTEDSDFEDLGPKVDSDDVSPDRVDSLEGDCGCRVPGASGAPGTPAAAALALAVALTLRGRRRGTGKARMPSASR